MDTPEKNRIAAVSFCNFEDSPVFQYINDLSPIEPVKQARTDNVLHSMAFASSPSIFSSPQINSLRDSRFSIKRHRSPDLSIPSVFLGETVRNSPDALEAGKASSPCEERQKFERPEQLDNESEAKPFKEHISLAIELAKSLENGRDGCDIQMGSCDEASTDAENAIGRVGSMEQSHELCRQPNVPLESDAELDGILQTEEKEADIDSGLENKTFDIGGIRNNEQHNPKISDPRFNSLASGHQQFSLCYNDSGNISEPGGSCSGQVAAGASDISISRSSEAAAIDSTAKAEDTEESGLQPSRKQRSVRRRCLTYDVGGSHKRIPLRDSTNDPPIEITPVNEAPKPHKFSDLSKKDTDEILPTPRTIGLHLNGLVNSSISNDRNILICKAGRVLSQGPTTFNRNLEDEFSTPVSTKGDLVSCDNNTMEEIPERSMEGESFGDDLTAGNGQLSQGLDELGSCKRCRCRKSKCLKLYCDCFAAGLYCIEPCSCQNCFNKPIHENIVMNTRRQIEARNPLAFAPKVISTSDSSIDLVDENSKTPASARHKRGCNCKKSGCLKKYCECFLMGVGCSPSCRCIGCKNVFGQTNEQFHFPCLVESDTVTINEENRENPLALELKSHDDKTVSSSTKIEEGLEYEVCNQIIRIEDTSVAL